MYRRTDEWTKQAHKGFCSYLIITENLKITSWKRCKFNMHNSYDSVHLKIGTYLTNFKFKSYEIFQLDTNYFVF